MNNAVSVITTLIFFGSMAALPGVAVYYVVKATRNRRRARAQIQAPVTLERIDDPHL